MGNKYPIYIISKGRFENPKTVNALNRMNVPYNICVEPAEYDEYRKTIDHDNIIRLPENFSERGQGSIPVRNWVFEDAIQRGHDKHWILDDNISSFYRMDRNTILEVQSDATFRACEDFTDRFFNIALSGMNYDKFVMHKSRTKPFHHNTRIYSCILINHEIPFRWRGRYNEDTDLSLRCLKAGWNTILFNAFPCGKMASLRDKGGNTDTIYNTGDNRREFAESLRRQHPDLVKVVWRYNRWHHQVDYRPFKNRRLEYRDDYIPSGDKVNNYGMVLHGPDEESTELPKVV
jgi:hypothetical protein